MGVYGYKERSREGEKVLEFCQGRELVAKDYVQEKGCYI